MIAVSSLLIFMLAPAVIGAGIAIFLYLIRENAEQANDND